ncbi:MAG TPA: plastocyanin/azurin family copper-binding protein, partial [Chloroflexota bacterium]|nr:plastocyanin/azurin family copper-binding protein [Chloroflexota bacterium]
GNAVVTIIDFAFLPQALTIYAGSSVEWVNSATTTQHTTTSSSGLWDSGVINPGGSFSVTFNNPGTYDYLCTFYPSGMTGTIYVIASLPTATPTAAITGTSTSSPTASSTPTGTRTVTPHASTPTATQTPTAQTSTSTSTPTQSRQTTTPTVTFTATPQATVPTATLTATPQTSVSTSLPTGTAMATASPPVLLLPATATGTATATAVPTQASTPAASATSQPTAIPTLTTANVTMAVSPQVPVQFAMTGPIQGSLILTSSVGGTLVFNPVPSTPNAAAAGSLGGGVVLPAGPPIDIQLQLSAPSPAGGIVRLSLPALAGSQGTFAWLQAIYDLQGQFLGYIRPAAQFDPVTNSLTFQLSPDDLHGTLFLPAFIVPAWVQNFDAGLHLYSGPTDNAIDFGAAGAQFTTFTVVAPQVAGRLYVYDPLTRNYGWINVASVGPSGAP